MYPRDRKVTTVRMKQVNKDVAITTEYYTNNEINQSSNNSYRVQTHIGSENHITKETAKPIHHDCQDEVYVQKSTSSSNQQNSTSLNDYDSKSENESSNNINHPVDNGDSSKQTDLQTAPLTDHDIVLSSQLTEQQEPPQYTD